jgi:NAD+ synthase
MRMVVLYHQADLQGLLVVGAANRTELLTGTFSHWGCDHCADVMPILHLYRSQLMPLAEYLQIPLEIRSKPADPDLLPGVDNKEDMLGAFEITDQVLWGLTNAVDKHELQRAYGGETVEQIETLWKRSHPMRETPYSLIF